MKVDDNILGSVADHDEEAALLLLYQCGSVWGLGDFALGLFLPALHS